MHARTILALAIASLSAAACTSAPGVIHGRTVTLHTATSVAGESMDAFVARAAPEALAASKAARATICGEVAATPEGFAIVFKTDGYVSDCALPQSARPYILVNGTAVDARENHFSTANRDRPGYLVTPWNVKFQGINARPRVVR